MIETELEMECLVIFLIQYTTSVRGQQENGPAECETKYNDQKMTERNRPGGREIERKRELERGVPCSGITPSAIKLGVVGANEMCSVLIRADDRLPQSKLTRLHWPR
jgi:hypothetical protein